VLTQLVSDGLANRMRPCRNQVKELWPPRDGTIDVITMCHQNPCGEHCTLSYGFVQCCVTVGIDLVDVGANTK
jgi:hypothetical protein